MRRMHNNMKNVNGKKYIALTNCHVFSGNENDQILNDAIIIIEKIKQEGSEKGYILNIGSANSIKIPEKAEVIDTKGAYIIPGLINAHCHLFGSGRLIVSASKDWMINLMVTAIKHWPLKLAFKKLIKQNLMNSLNAGVTTVRCLGDPFFYDIEVKSELENSAIPAPRMICSGMGLGSTGAHAAILSTQSDSPWEFRKAVRRNIRKQADIIKLFSTGGAADSKRVGEAGCLQMTPEEITAACDEAHRANYSVACHAQSTKGVHEALIGGVDTIEHGADLTDEMVELFKINPKSLKGLTALIPTLSPVLHLSEIDAEKTKISSTMIENVKLIREGIIKGLQRALSEGIEIGIGNDAAMPLVTHYDFWRELFYISKYADISPKKTISLATISNARILGIDNLTGSLVPGKSADLIAFKNNPLDDLLALSKPEFVMISGKCIHKPTVKKFPKIDSMIEPIWQKLSESI
jgi:imidazolonepropionase-like amidohydrolase